MVRYAIIGCGGISGAHLRGLATLKGEGIDKFDLVAVCDIDGDRAGSFTETAKEKLGVRPAIYTDHRKMLDEMELDAVGVNTSHKAHHLIAKDCLEAGKPSLVEKPLAIVPSAGRELIELAKTKGVTLGVAENYRRSPACRAVKKIIAEGVIGKPYMIVKQFASVGDNVFCRTPWRHLKSEGGPGPILDNGVHDADLFLYWLGEVDEVSSYNTMFETYRKTDDLEVEPTNEDTDVSILKFKSGALGNWVCSWAGHGKGMHGNMLFGSSGSIVNGALTVDGEETRAQEDYVREYAPGIREDTMATELEDFADALSEGRAPETDCEVGYKALCIPYAALESAVTGRPVKVEDIESGEARQYEDTVIAAMEE